MQKEFKIKIVLIYLSFSIEYSIWNTVMWNQGEKEQNNNFPKWINFTNFES